MFFDVPETLGPYRIDSLIAVGGMGEVYRGWDETHRRIVALKRLVPEDVEDRKLRRRFRREALAASRLDHPTIPRVHEVLRTEHGDWIVMDYVAGTTLSRWVEIQGVPAIDRLLEIAEDLAEGLAEAHSKKIIHRDLKGENILVGDDGAVHILDFGLAKVDLDIQESDSTTLTILGAMVGTCRSMSPEQAISDRIDHRSDLFSLGSLLYEILAGKSPFEASTPLQVVARVVGFQQPPIRQHAPWVPPELEELIDQLLEKDPERRPQNAAEVASRLRAIRLGGHRRARLRRWGRVAAVALLTAALGSSGLYLWRDSAGEVRTPPVPDEVESTTTLDTVAGLGFRCMLSRRFTDAEERYAEAVDLAPERPDLLLAHADALFFLGRDTEAAARYRQVIEQVDSFSGWKADLIRARALAHLGHRETALGMLGEIGDPDPDDPSAAFEMAVVYSFLDHPESALTQVARALQAGLDPAWLRTPWLDPLRSDPRFAEILDAAGGAER